MSMKVLIALVVLLVCLVFSDAFQLSQKNVFQSKFSNIVKTNVPSLHSFNVPISLKLHIAESYDFHEKDGSDLRRQLQSKVEKTVHSKAKKEKIKESEEIITRPFNIVRKEIPLNYNKCSRSLQSNVDPSNQSIASIIANSAATNIVQPETRNHRRIDPEESDFYSIDDPNDYLSEDELQEANSVLNTRKVISNHFHEMLNDLPPADVTFIRPRFHFSFWALQYLNDDTPAVFTKAFEKRLQLWTDHLQWSRRSQLLSLVPRQNLSSYDVARHPSARALIEEEFTVLAADRLRPIAQVVRIQADSLTDAKEYLTHDPLFSAGVYSMSSERHIFPTQRIPSLDTDIENTFEADLMSPYIAHVYLDHNNNTKTNNKISVEKEEELVQMWVAQSRRFQEETVDLKASVTYNAPQKNGTDRKDVSLLQRNASLQALFYETHQHRIHHLAVTHARPVPHFKDQYKLETGVAEAFHDNENNRDDNGEDNNNANSIINPATGMLLLLNAHSQRDAMRFLQQDPLFRTFRISLETLGISSVSRERVVFQHPELPRLRLLLAPVHLIDVNGLHLLQPTNFASQAALDAFHALQPTDLLMKLPNPLLKDIMTEKTTFAEEYLAENQWVLQQLRLHKIDTNYTWVSNLRKLGIVAQYNLPEPPENFADKATRPMNLILDVSKPSVSPVVSEDTSPHDTTQHSKDNELQEENDNEEIIDVLKQDDEEEEQGGGDKEVLLRGRESEIKKSGWQKPLMGRRAFVAINRYAAIATRRLLDRMDFYVPFEDGALAQVPGYLLDPRSSARSGAKVKSKSLYWAQKQVGKQVPTTTEDKKTALDQSVDFFFGTSDSSNNISGDNNNDG